MKPRGQLKAAIYCRISLDKDGKGTNVAMQADVCRRWCRDNGWNVVEVFIDNDISAADRRKRRPEYRRLLDEIKSGRFDGLVAQHLDRLYRLPRELEDLIDYVEVNPGFLIKTVQGGQYDLSTSDGRANARVVTVFSKKASEDTSRRLKLKHETLAREGKAISGTRPFGYVDGTRTRIKESEAKILRGAAERLLSGASKMEVVRWMNDNSKTATGKRWTLLTAMRILDSAAIAGIRELHAKDLVNRQVMNEAAWPAIVSPETHRELRSLLSGTRGHGRGRRAPSRYLLTGGLARCGLCGVALIAQPRPHAKDCPAVLIEGVVIERNGEVVMRKDGKGPVRSFEVAERAEVCTCRQHKSYRCPQPNNPAWNGGCGHIRIQGEPFEEHVISVALGWATSPDVIAQQRVEAKKMKDEAGKVRAELRSLDSKEKRLNDVYVDGEVKMKPSEYRRKLDELRGERTRLDRRLTKLTNALAPALARGHMEEVRARWDELTLNERRKVLQSLLVEVKVHPGLVGRNTFDPNRVEVRPDWGPALEQADRATGEGFPHTAKEYLAMGRDEAVAG